MTTPAGAVSANASQAQRETRDPKGGGFFQRKYGPLPGWGWALLAGGGALAYFWWRRRSLSQNTAGSSGYTGSSTSGSVDDQLAAIQDEIDQLQGELATSGTGTTGGPPPPGPDSVTVPKVEGMRSVPAVSRLSAAGLHAHQNPPAKGRAPGSWKVVSQTPGAGKKVPVGSTVDLHLEKERRARK